MTELAELLDRLEVLLAEVDALGDENRATVVELLDGIDALHRVALSRLTSQLDPALLANARAADPSVAWLLDAYGLGLDQAAVANAALDEIRPYIHSHGGQVEVLAAEDGVVSLRLAGACSGCTASAVTLREGVERALHEHFPGFARMEVEADDAPAHPPPAPLLQIATRLSPS